jgi:hypothetical protein
MGSTEQRPNRLETLATILLALSAVATAWSTFQSATWRGEQASQTAKSTAARIQSSQAATRGGQLTQVDIATFVQWVDATSKGDGKLARFYRARFRDEFTPAFDAWLATHPLTNPAAPKTPFAMPQYRVAEDITSAQLNTLAGEQAGAAGRADKRADNYMLAVVLFATALFFAGISTKLTAPTSRRVILIAGCAVFVGALIWIATQPIQVQT